MRRRLERGCDLSIVRRSRFCRGNEELGALSLDSYVARRALLLSLISSAHACCSTASVIVNDERGICWPREKVISSDGDFNDDGVGAGSGATEAAAMGERGRERADGSRSPSWAKPHILKRLRSALLAKQIHMKTRANEGSPDPTWDAWARHEVWEGVRGGGRCNCVSRKAGLSNNLPSTGRACAAALNEPKTQILEIF